MSASADPTLPHPKLRPMSRIEPLIGLLSPIRLVTGLWASRSLIVQFSKRELFARNKGSTLGIVWTLLHPLLMLAVYTFVFAVVWKARWTDGDAAAHESNVVFATSVFCGLIVFDIFGSTVGAASGLIVNHPNYVKKVIFPIEILPLAHLGAALCVSCISTCVLLAGTLLVSHTISSTVWCYPLVMIPLIMFTAGIGWLLASLGVFLRDLRQVVSGVLLPVMFFLTPIFYPPSRVPEAFRWVTLGNPIAGVIENARRTLLYGQYPDWVSLGYSALLGAVVMQLGFAFFMKSRRSFADVL